MHLFNTNREQLIFISVNIFGMAEAMTTSTQVFNFLMSSVAADDASAGCGDEKPAARRR